MVSMVTDLILDKVLGAYLRLGERKLDFSSGTLTIKNVAVREDVLDGLGLPVAVRGGEIGELELQVPWTKLKTESVVIKIHGLVLLLAPVSEAEWDEVAERQRAAARKERTLQRLRAQLQRTEPAKPANKEEADQNFAERILSRVLNNLQARRAATPTTQAARPRYAVRASTSACPAAGGGDLGVGAVRGPLALACAVCARGGRPPPPPWPRTSPMARPSSADLRTAGGARLALAAPVARDGARGGGRRRGRRGASPAAEARGAHLLARGRNGPFARLEDGAASARLVAPRAQAAPTQCRAPPRQLGRARWPQQLASARAQDEVLATPRLPGALCAYVLQGDHVPPEPQRTTCSGEGRGARSAPATAGRPGARVLGPPGTA